MSKEFLAKVAHYGFMLNIRPKDEFVNVQFVKGWHTYAELTASYSMLSNILDKGLSIAIANLAFGTSE